METLQLTIEFVAITCYRTDCACTFAVARSYYNKLRETHNSFYCPHGHSQCYHKKSEAEELRDLLSFEKQKAERYMSYYQNEQKSRAHVERRLCATHGQITKIKNRVSKGVCPCCNRTFTDLQRHMACKHPDYAETEK